MVQSISDIRDLLMPALGINTYKHGDDYYPQILIDYRDDSLVVKIYRRSTKKTVDFTITRKDIDDGSFENDFKPKLLQLFKDLQ